MSAPFEATRFKTSPDIKPSTLRSQFSDTIDDASDRIERESACDDGTVCVALSHPELVFTADSTTYNMPQVNWRPRLQKRRLSRRKPLHRCDYSNATPRFGRR